MEYASGITLESGSGIPLYQQLFDQLAERIRNGTYPGGHRLPPTRELASELSTHRNTVVRAYEQLETAGFVQSTVGRGTFVVAAVKSAAPAEPVERDALPWSSLTSNALAVEPLGRANRLTAHLAAAGAIDLRGQQPSPDLIPETLLHRCIDHVLKSSGAKAFGYAPREGLLRLRQAIVADLARQGVPASVEDLLITTGSQQALDMVARALINPGDTFLVDEATYAGALNLLSVAGARLAGVPNDDEGPDLAYLERIGRGGAKGFYVMPNCQNPTGLRISRARRQALIEWSHQRGIPLVEDDYASDLQLSDSKPEPALRAMDGQVIYIGTYSKKLAPALRIGYLLCPRRLQKEMLALKHAMDLGTSGLLQYVLAEFLERGYLDAHLRTILPEYRKRRDALESSLRKHLPSDVKWRQPQAGLQLWLPLPEDMDPEALYREAQRQGVMVSPDILNRVGAAPNRGLRLTYCGEPPGRLSEGGKRLGKVFAALEKRPRSRKQQPAEGVLGAL